MTTRGAAVTTESSNGELTPILEQRVHQRRAGARRSSDPPSGGQRHLSQTRISAAAAERRRVARDLHDGVQNELVALIVELRLAEEDRDTPPALAAKLSALGPRVEATLDAIREIAHGVHPPLLAASGFVEAIRVQAERASMTVRLEGTAPRVRYRDGKLAVRIEDDGGGFIRVPGREGLGLTNIHDRIAAVEGTVRITSTMGRGTVVALALPWPAEEAASPGDRIAFNQGRASHD